MIFIQCSSFYPPPFPPFFRWGNEIKYWLEMCQMYHESPHKIVKGIAKCLHKVLTQLSFVEKFLYESMETNRLKNGLLKTPYPNNCKRSSTKYVRDIFRKTNVLIVARLDIAFFFSQHLLSLQRIWF